MLTIKLVGSFSISGKRYSGCCSWEIRCLPTNNTLIELPNCPTAWEPSEFFLDADDYSIQLQSNGEFALYFEMEIDEACNDAQFALQEAGWNMRRLGDSD